jgi:hypothetical protein
MSINFQQTTRRYTPKDRSLHNHRCETSNPTLWFKFKIPLLRWTVKPFLFSTLQNVYFKLQAPFGSTILHFQMSCFTEKNSPCTGCGNDCKRKQFTYREGREQQGYLVQAPGLERGQSVCPSIHLSVRLSVYLSMALQPLWTLTAFSVS